MTYKNLLLDKEQLKNYIDGFITEKELRIDSLLEPFNEKIALRCVFGHVGIPSATVDLFFNNDGTTTINYKTGKNPDLGEKLAVYLQNQINSAEFQTIEMIIQHIKLEDFDKLIAQFTNETDLDKTPLFDIQLVHDNASLKQVRVKSIKHKDSLVLKLHKQKQSFQIQGKPLFTYKKFCFHVMDSLDILGLEKILSRCDSSRVCMIEANAAEAMLKHHYPETFKNARRNIINLMISGMCISLATPSMPDYSLLLYPDLRALEGAMHDCFTYYGLYSSRFSDNNNAHIGCMFDFSNKTQSYSLKSEHSAIIQNNEMINALEEAYNHYKGQRHRRFHMTEQGIFDIMEPDLNRVMALIQDTRDIIEDLYIHKK